MGKLVTSFRELDVYQNALNLAVDVHTLCKAFPADEKYVLSDQMRRSSRSVCGNVTEAWRKRRYKASFIAKLSDAETEATEVQCWLDVGHRLGYIDHTIKADLDTRYEKVIGQLVRMINSANKWCQL